MVYREGGPGQVALTWMIARSWSGESWGEGFPRQSHKGENARCLWRKQVTWSLCREEWNMEMCRDARGSPAVLDG